MVGTPKLFPRGGPGDYVELQPEWLAFTSIKCRGFNDLMCGPLPSTPLRDAPWFRKSAPSH